MGTYHRNAKKRFQKKGRMEMKEYLEKVRRFLMSYRQRSRDFPRRKLRGGFPNTDPTGWRREKKKSNLQRFFEELKDPMILILPLAAALIFRHHIGV